MKPVETSEANHSFNSEDQPSLPYQVQTKQNIYIINKMTAPKKSSSIIKIIIAGFILILCVLLIVVTAILPVDLNFNELVPILIDLLKIAAGIVLGL